MRYLPLLILFLSPSLGSAQFQHTFYQTFELSDSIKQLEISVSGNFKLETWVGNTILVETKVVLENGNRALFNFLSKTGRYQIAGQQVDSTLQIKSEMEAPPMFITPSGPTREQVNTKIMIPDVFGSVDSLNWVLKPEF